MPLTRAQTRGRAIFGTDVFYHPKKTQVGNVGLRCAATYHKITSTHQSTQTDWSDIEPEIIPVTDEPIHYPFRLPEPDIPMLDFFSD